MGGIFLATLLVQSAVGMGAGGGIGFIVEGLKKLAGKCVGTKVSNSDSGEQDRQMPRPLDTHNPSNPASNAAPTIETYTCNLVELSEPAVCGTDACPITLRKGQRGTQIINNQHCTFKTPYGEVEVPVSEEEYTRISDNTIEVDEKLTTTRIERKFHGIVGIPIPLFNEYRRIIELKVTKEEAQALYWYCEALKAQAGTIVRHMSRDLFTRKFLDTMEKTLQEIMSKIKDGNADGKQKVERHLMMQLRTLFKVEE